MGASVASHAGGLRLCPLSKPPANPRKALARFPRRALATTHETHRIHSHQHGPWWFSDSGAGRFDLAGVPGMGTCYVAEDSLGAFIEVFRDFAGRGIIAEVDVDQRRASILKVPRDVAIADCMRSRARSFEVTAAIHSSEDYSLTQGWARAFLEAGFNGVRYRVSHDPSQRLLGVALFGPVGAQQWPVKDTDRISAQTRRQALARLGIRILPSPRGS